MNDLEFMLHFARFEAYRRSLADHFGMSIDSYHLRMNDRTWMRAEDLFKPTCMAELWGDSYGGSDEMCPDDFIEVIAHPARSR